MPITVQIEAETGMAIITGTGTLRLDDAKEGATALWNSPNWRGLSAVWDFREAQFEMKASDPKEIAEFVLEHQPKTPPRKMAFIPQRNVDFGMARMFEAFRGDEHTVVRVFRDQAEALDWARSLEPNSE